MSDLAAARKQAEEALWATYGSSVELARGLEAALTTLLDAARDHDHEGHPCEGDFTAPAQPAPLEEAVKEALWRFGAVMLREFWDDGNPGDIDGGAAQEAAEEHGLWHQVERHADGVECEWCGNEGPCGELTEVGLAALSARGRGERT